MLQVDDPIVETFEPLRDTRRYCLVATLGTGSCPLCEPYGPAVCKQKYEDKDHEHACAIRIGYDSAADWALRKRNSGWVVRIMDRIK